MGNSGALKSRYSFYVLYWCLKIKLYSVFSVLIFFFYFFSIGLKWLNGERKKGLRQQKNTVENYRKKIWREKTISLLLATIKVLS